jgi:hypothetical protein
MTGLIITFVASMTSALIVQRTARAQDASLIAKLVDLAQRRRRTRPQGLMLLRARGNAVVAAAILLAATSVLHDATCVAQEKPALARIAEMVVRKGYKDVKLGVFCKPFGLAGRAQDGECKGYQINDEDVNDEPEKRHGWQKGWIPSFNTFVERRTGKTRIILADHDASLGYGFLVSPEGDLLNAMLFHKVSEGEDNWAPTAVGITSDLRAKFEVEKSIWITWEQEIADLPDRKD